MSQDDELDGERGRRAADTARRLLEVAARSIGGDLDQELRRVAADEAHGVLGAVLRHLAGLVAAQQLREFDPADVEADEDRDEGAAAVLDETLPADPFVTSHNEVANTIEDAGLTFNALVDQPNVPALLRAIGALDEEEAVMVLFAEALRQMAARQLGSDRR